MKKFGVPGENVPVNPVGKSLTVAEDSIPYTIGSIGFPRQINWLLVFGAETNSRVEPCISIFHISIMEEQVPVAETI